MKTWRETSEEKIKEIGKPKWFDGTLVATCVLWWCRLALVAIVPWWVEQSVVGLPAFVVVGFPIGSGSLS